MDNLNVYGVKTTILVFHNIYIYQFSNKYLNNYYMYFMMMKIWNLDLDWKKKNQPILHYFALYCTASPTHLFTI